LYKDFGILGSLNNKNKHIEEDAAANTMDTAHTVKAINFLNFVDFIFLYPHY
jgi:hypothetical protein